MQKKKRQRSFGLEYNFECTRMSTKTFILLCFHWFSMRSFWLFLIGFWWGHLVCLWLVSCPHIMNLLHYSLDLYCSIAVQDRALSLQPGYSHTTKMICTHSTITFTNYTRVCLIFSHTKICMCCGARVTCSNLPLIYALPAPLFSGL